MISNLRAIWADESGFEESVEDVHDDGGIPLEIVLPRLCGDLGVGATASVLHLHVRLLLNPV